MRYFLCVFGLLFSFCKSDNIENQLVVSVDKIALRVSPGIRGAEIVTLDKGAKLLDLGDVSHFESEIWFGDQSQRMPWLKVQTADKQLGWVFAGAVQPKGNAAGWLLQKRLDCYFGHPFAVRLNACRESLRAVKTDAEFAGTFRTAIAMRDSMIYLLLRRAEPNGRPDYGWLSDILPGFVYQRAYEGGPPNLYADYRYWQQEAAKTQGNADDTFLEICFMIFPADSIESFFPVWEFQTTAVGSASQLGTGAHLKVLRQIDKTLAQSRLFEPELMRLKDAVLEDIQDHNTRFWQSKELILKELDEMIADPPACLTEAESSALRPRRVMLSDPEKNWIKVNLRSGE